MFSFLSEHDEPAPIPASSQRDCLSLKETAVQYAGRKMLVKGKSRPPAISMKVRGGVKGLK